MGAIGGRESSNEKMGKRDRQILQIMALIEVIGA